jgi:hypothetical protein
MHDLYRQIQQILESLPADQPEQSLQRLFCEALNWNAPRGLARLSLEIGAPVSRALTFEPIAQVASLPVFCVRWHEERAPTLTARRAVQRALAPTYAEHLLCYVVCEAGVPTTVAFTWARKRPDGKTELRTLPYTIGAPARTTLERLAELHFSLQDKEPTITEATERLNRAFSVESVTEAFFRDYCRVFESLQQYLLANLPETERGSAAAKAWAHDYALQLLNRVMFLYFIQRKRWLGNNTRFLYHFWQSYKHSGQPKDTFFQNWLRILFFEAFNNRFHGWYVHFPQEVREALQMAPYLNGGLFRENELDTRHSISVPDEFFELLFDRFENSEPGFFERYNFTVTESTPLDVEVAVDPEMIGKVYESLVNITFGGSTEEDLRGKSGIFYTPRVEIDLMCRLSLVDALANQLGEEYKALLYDAVFAYELSEKEAADNAIAEHNLWPRLNEILRSLTVCDPACGSGSFLVGMLLVLDDLQARADTQLGKEETPYERRRRIIGEQLYGVDVMDWAVHVAELRLWLQLVVETELQPAELKFRPLLPNLSFKIRQGDSLVQEVAGINFNLHRQQLDIPPHLKGKLTQLKGKKLRFYQGNQEIHEEDLKNEELILFREVLRHKIHSLESEIAQLQGRLEAQQSQQELYEAEPASQQPSHSSKEQSIRAQLEEKQAALAQFQKAIEALRTVQDVPFVWDIAFVEIFEGDSRGFDIVIGNPPYVRHEKIAPPLERKNDYDPDQWQTLKTTYKRKLQHSIAVAWHRFFQYKPGKDTFRKIDSKSDLYVYFYFHSLSLLNPKGSFCFITSNSWLDVGYGTDLQEFLLKHSHVKLILDNEVKRSFAQADVNTVIVLLAPPNDSRAEGLNKTARFVMFKKPFEEIARAEIFKAIESVADRQSTDAYRVTTRSQREMLEEGLETDDVETQSGTPKPSRGPLIKTARYIGNKWGGKYLRAPDIFFTILEKSKGKLVRLGDIAEIRRGFTTGANDFFYLEPTGKPAPTGYLHVRNGFGWEGEIEEKFLKPVIKSPREVSSIYVPPTSIKTRIFVCNLPKTMLTGTKAIDYINWGEKQTSKGRQKQAAGIPLPELPTLRGKELWYSIELKRPADFFCNRFFDDRIFFCYSNGVVEDQTFYGGLLKVQGVSVVEQVAILNSSLTYLTACFSGRFALGEGVLQYAVYEMCNLFVLSADAFTKATLEALMEPFSLLKTRAIHEVEREMLQPDRRALDDVLFDALGLTVGEREAVYEAVIDLVQARLKKAESV